MWAFLEWAMGWPSPEQEVEAQIKALARIARGLQRQAGAASQAANDATTLADNALHKARDDEAQDHALRAVHKAREARRYRAMGIKMDETVSGLRMIHGTMGAQAALVKTTAALRWAQRKIPPVEYARVLRDFKVATEAQDMNQVDTDSAVDGLHETMDDQSEQLGTNTEDAQEAANELLDKLRDMKSVASGDGMATMMTPKPKTKGKGKEKEKEKQHAGANRPTDPNDSA